MRRIVDFFPLLAISTNFLFGENIPGETAPAMAGDVAGWHSVYGRKYLELPA